MLVLEIVLVVSGLVLVLSLVNLLKHYFDKRERALELQTNREREARMLAIHAIKYDSEEQMARILQEYKDNEIPANLMNCMVNRMIATKGVKQ